MMRAFFYYLPIFGVLLCSCAQRLDELEMRVDDLNERAEILESRQGLPIGEDRELLQGRRLADIRTQLSSFQNDLRVLKGQIESIEFENEDFAERLDHLSRDLEVRLTAVEDKLDQVDAPEKNREEELYDRALLAHQNSDFSLSRELFRDFLEEFPDSSLQDNALFWVGRSYMEESLYEDAVIHFQDLIDAHPESDKYCDALKEQTEAFKALEMTEEVEVFSQAYNEECQ